MAEIKKELSNDDCTICQGTEEGELIILDCGHPFHENCIKPWQEATNTCPNCMDCIDKSKPQKKIRVDDYLSGDVIQNLDLSNLLQLARSIFRSRCTHYYCAECRKRYCEEHDGDYPCHLCNRLHYCSDVCREFGWMDHQNSCTGLHDYTNLDDSDMKHEFDILRQNITTIFDIINQENDMPELEEEGDPPINNNIEDVSRESHPQNRRVRIVIDGVPVLIPHIRFPNFEH
jgi:hypothetical protein